jgi:oligoribonuclease NrnB/cAMP/cGMP phosphodiesterase (DHH superfamily)
MIRCAVVYHGGCPDGFTSAWLLSKVLPNAVYIPKQPNHPIPIIEDLIELGFTDNEAADARIIYVDLHPSPLQLKKLNETYYNTPVIIDHHKSTNELVGTGYPCHLCYNTQKSAAMLTYGLVTEESPLRMRICFKLKPELERYKRFVEYIQDRDLYTNCLPMTKEISAAIRSYPMTFESWDDIADKIDEKLIPIGAAIEQYRQSIIKPHIDYAREITIADYKILGTPCTAYDIISDVANVLAKGRPFAATWFDMADGTRVYSLRSDPDGVDVEQVAKMFGGGGHKHAAGFRVPNAR